MNKRKWIKYNENILKSHPHRDGRKSKNFVKDSIKDYTHTRVNELISEFNAVSKAKGSDGMLKFIVELMNVNASQEMFVFALDEVIKRNDCNDKQKVRAIKDGLTEFINIIFYNEKKLSKKFRNK